MSKPSSMGESNAYSGFFYQDGISAELIYDALIKNDFKKVHFLDPDVGSVDDCVIFRHLTNTIEFYQMKHSENPYISFNEFFLKQETTKSGEKRPSLFSQLVSSWRTVVYQNPDCNIRIFFATDRVPSTRDRTIKNLYGLNDPKPKSLNFDTFFTSVIRSVQNSDEFQIPEEWKPVWKVLEEQAELDFDQLMQFLKILTLQFGVKYEFAESSLDQQVLEEDVRNLAKKIYEIKGDNKNKSKIILDRIAVLDLMRWNSRFPSEFNQDFQKPVNIYAELSSTAKTLTTMIDKTTSGYLALIGSPGSGKSTLLDHLFRDRRFRAIHYFAYTQTYSGSLKNLGEATYFYRLILTQIEKWGITNFRSALPFEIELLRERFVQTLEKVAEDYVKTKLKTILIIDGLDHIPREYFPSKSLLEELPDPTSIPAGIIIVLGSQTISLDKIPKSVQASLQSPERTITIGSLDKEGTSKIINAVNLGLTPYHIDQFFEKTQGHPLYTQYLAEKIKTTEPIRIAEVINDAPICDGDISLYYEKIWTDIKQEKTLTKILGVICRIQKRINLRLLETHYEVAKLQEIEQKFAHLFIRDRYYWRFFHISFCQFLQKKTAEFPEGVEDPALIKEYHSVLADLYLDPTSPFPEEKYFGLYHLIQSDQKEDAIKLLTQDFFQEQFESLRNPRLIQEDLSNALVYFMDNLEFEAFIRCFFAGIELDQYSSNLDSTSIIRLLIKMGEKEKAIEWVYYNGKISLPSHNFEESVLNSIIPDIVQIDPQIGNQIFALCKPFKLLTGFDIVERHTFEVLQSYIISALYFQSIDEIIETIENLRYYGEEMKEWVKLHFFSQILKIKGQSPALEYFKSTDWSQKSNLNIYYLLWRNAQNPSDLYHYFHLFKDEWLHCPDTFQEKYRIYWSDLIHGILDIDKDSNAAYDIWNLMHVEQYFFDQDSRLNFDFLNQYLDIFCLFHTKVYKFDEFQAIFFEKLQSKLDSDSKFFIFLIYQIYFIPHVDRDEIKSYFELLYSHLLDFYKRFPRNNLELIQSRSYLYDTLKWDEIFALMMVKLRIEQQSLLNLFFDKIISEWEDIELWPSHIQREFLLSFYENGIDKSKIIPILEQIEGHMLEGLGPGGKTSELINQSWAWITLDLNEKAKKNLSFLAKSSFGLGYRKDYQLESWANVLKEYSELNPDEIPQNVAFFIECVKNARETTEGHGNSQTVQTLLSLSCGYHPSYARKILDQLIDENLVTIFSGLNPILLKIIEQTTGLLELKKILSFVNQIMIPLSMDPDFHIVFSLLSKLQSVKEAELKHIILEIQNQVSIYAMKKNRDKWFLSIALFLSKSRIQIDAPLEKPDIIVKRIKKSDSYFEEREIYSILNEDESSETKEELLSILEKKTDYGPYTTIEIYEKLKQYDIGLAIKYLKQHLKARLLDENPYFSILIPSLRDITRFLFPNHNVRYFWDELIKYINLLIPSTNSLSSFHFSKISNYNLIETMLMELLQKPIPILQDFALKNCYKIILIGDNHFLEVLIDEFEKSEDSRIQILIILSLAKVNGTTLPPDLISKILEFKQSDNFIIRILIKKLFGLDDIHIPTNNFPTFPNSLDEISEEQIDELFRPWTNLIENFARLGKMEPILLKRAILSILNITNVSGLHLFIENTRNNDKSIQEYRKKAGLPYAYIYTQINLVRNSIILILGKFFKDHILQTDLYLDLQFQTYEYLITQRPVEIPGIQIKMNQHTTLSGKDWVETVPTNLPLERIGDLKIIAERSRLVCYYGDLYREVRELYRIPTQYIKRKQQLINYSHGDYFLIDPKLFRELNWKEQSNTAIWYNKDNELVAKLIFWQDGNPEFSDREFDLEAGSGCVFVVTDEGYKSIELFFGRIEPLSRVYRKVGPYFRGYIKSGNGDWQSY